MPREEEKQVTLKNFLAAKHLKALGMKKSMLKKIISRACKIRVHALEPEISLDISKFELHAGHVKFELHAGHVKFELHAGHVKLELHARHVKFELHAGHVKFELHAGHVKFELHAGHVNSNYMPGM